MLYTELEKDLKRIVPRRLMQRIAHIGSTAVPGLSAKPVVDVQVEVADLEAVRDEVVPLMEEAGYEFIWRPTMGEQVPFYAWFIGRNAAGQRTAHIHMVEPDAASEDRVLFRDFLRTHPQDAQRYERLKLELLEAYPQDRAAFTQGKSAFIASILNQARQQ